MNTIDWSLLTDVTFKTQCFRKNFDMISNDENFITECDGEISVNRFEEQKPSLIIGEYGFSVWSIKMGTQFNANFHQLIEEHDNENMYRELKELINKRQFDIQKFNKIILVHSLVLRADYRKHGITEEFTEFLYRDYYDENNAVIVLVLPFQNNPIDKEYYLERKSVPIRQNLGVFNDAVHTPAIEYYSLDDLMRKRDDELNEYKLFSVATKCGFNRIGDSHLFMLSPEKTINRMNEKYNNLK